MVVLPELKRKETRLSVSALPLLSPQGNLNSTNEKMNGCKKKLTVRCRVAAAADEPGVRGHGEVRHSGSGSFRVYTFTHTHTFKHV